MGLSCDFNTVSFSPFRGVLRLYWYELLTPGMEIALPDTQNVAWFMIGLLVGLPAPYWFAAERIKGFSRAWLLKLPYQPPPGAEEDEAMQEATEDE